ncbi:MAG TPA: hypothetical protein DCY07_08040 [Rhodospirillaceae bacterium]|nr:hypothetical protein [Rhodospirillaceae bacterium]
MNANKLFLAAGFAVFCWGVLPTAALAQTPVAPSLYGVGEIQVQHTRLANPAVTATCGLSSGEISHIALKSLKNDELPAFSVINAPASKEDVARIDLLPTVASMQTNETSCTSWIAFSAQGRNLVVLPPVSTARSVVVTYWEGGLLVHSTVEKHPQALVNAIDKLVVQFARQYRLDQPPEISAPEPDKKP